MIQKRLQGRNYPLPLGPNPDVPATLDCAAAIVAMTPALAAVARAALPPSARKLCTAELAQVAAPWEGTLRFVVGLPHSVAPRASSAAVLGAYAKALAAGLPRPAVSRFARIMANGEVSLPHDSAAVRARNWCMAHPARGIKSSERVERAIMRALLAFAWRERMLRLRVPSEAPFPPLPVGSR